MFGCDVVTFCGPLPNEGGCKLTPFLVYRNISTMHFVSAHSSKFVTAELTSTVLRNL